MQKVLDDLQNIGSRAWGTVRTLAKGAAAQLVR